MRRIEALGDTTGTAGAVQRGKATVMQQEDPVGDSAHTCQLVGGDDGRRSVASLFSHEVRGRASSTDVEPIVVEQQPIGGTPFLADGWHIDELRSQTELDGAGVGAPQAGETVEERRGARTACTEDGDALSMLDVEARPRRTHARAEQPTTPAA